MSLESVAPFSHLWSVCPKPGFELGPGVGAHSLARAEATRGSGWVISVPWGPFCDRSVHRAHPGSCAQGARRPAERTSEPRVKGAVGVSPVGK